MNVESGEDAASRDPLLGVVLGDKYRLESLIARGGTGAVYRATQLPIGRAVAVKIMRADLDDVSREMFEERFLREAAQIGGLQHPNIVTLHDFGRTEAGVCYLVMELLEGSTLKAALSGGPMATQWGLDISIQIARGLRAAHRKGLIHRDIKAGNVIISPDEDGRPQAKLLDFGLVKMVDEHTLTGPDVFLGTPHYVSPEQAQGREVDARGDVYSLGVLMYRIFSGKLPYYSSQSPMAIAMAHIQQPYPPMSVRAPSASVPPLIEAIVRRCMDKDPDNRYRDAQPLYDALLEARQELFPELAPLPAETIAHSTALGGLPVPPPAPASSPPVAEARPGPARSSGWFWLGVPAMALLVITSLGGLWLAAAQFQAPAQSPAGVVPTPASTPPGTTAEAPAPREVPILVSSEPAGATVLLDGDALGETPFAGRLTLQPGEPTLRLLTLHKEGHHDVEVAVDLSGAQAAAHATLSPLPRTRTPTTPAPPPAAADKPPPSTDGGGGGTVYADEVAFTAAEAAATVAFLNRASEEELRAAGIAGKQVAVILEQRPFASIQAFAETYFIGTKTVEAARRAAL